jgi:hypothetical protein
MKKSIIFWVSFSDFMMSLFCVMLVLYVVTPVLLLKQQEGLQADADKLTQIKNVEEALTQLDSNYFKFDKSNKRYKLAIDAIFNRNSARIRDISKAQRLENRNAGYELLLR